MRCLTLLMSCGFATELVLLPPQQFVTLHPTSK
ncbi:hypothetical protein CGLO_12596 [Colletotrichum gloeosporioides Cg-14]|uniref:Uncharacterized protein n=1 Tax=Colletotrichum gloeosporioides (strain Cg-14) TaxID=1237896 RepID=T0K855_COLGC|nr:hypothetical protein CGLO_12596 [Colletotrichum gloeosporioides Cg-14]